MEKRKIVFLCFVILFLMDALVLNSCEQKESAKTGLVIVEKNSKVEPYICSGKSCERVLLGVLENASKSIHCAFYSLTLRSVKDVLENKSKIVDVRLVLHNESIHPGLMHNKFCVVDGQIVITGSYNPTRNQHRNNVVIIRSKTIADQFEQEFEELAKGEFASGRKTSIHSVLANRTKISVFFCPEDYCEEVVYSILRKAKSSIYFMQYVFTSDKIATILALKSFQGVDVKGVFERSRISEYSTYHFLKYQNVSVFYDPFKEYVHHKVFIVDNETVITGSFNPTKSGNTRNDENLVVISDREIARVYLEEFNYILSKI